MMHSEAVKASLKYALVLAVTVDGELQHFDSRFHAGQMKGKVVRHMTFFGQYVEIITPSFTYAVNAVQPSTTDSGLQRGHADIDITLRKAMPGLHGLLGQSYQNVVSRECADNFDFPGEGAEEDYVLASISGVPASRVLAKASRKLIESIPAELPLTASTFA